MRRPHRKRYAASYLEVGVQTYFCAEGGKALFVEGHFAAEGLSARSDEHTL